MHNEYEDYMKSVLGYPVAPVGYGTYNNIYEYGNSYFPYKPNQTHTDTSLYRFEEKYPDIYKVLKPMIKKITNNVVIDNISDDQIEKMTDEIYSNIEQDMNVVNINVRTTDKNENKRTNIKSEAVVEDEKRSCCGNSTLRDLIKILLLNQLINNRPNKPHMPGRPPRPPMPPHNGPMPRPPFRGEYEDYQPYNDYPYNYYN